MGCHTWFLKPVDIHYGQAKQIVIDYLTKGLERWTVENILYSPDKNGDINPYNWTEESVVLLVKLSGMKE
jgi:hypothetical protein